MQITDEILMAFVDDELEARQSREVRAALARDPRLQARLRVFTKTRRVLRDAAASPHPLADDAALIVRVRAAGTAPAATPFPRPPSVPPPPNHNRRPLGAIAAALAAAVVGLCLWQWGGPAPGLSEAQLAALNGLASGESRGLPGGESVVMIASFLMAGETLCREYETRSAGTATLMIACREDDGWSRRFTMSMTEAEGYVPASGGIEALDAFLAESAAGAPLGPEEEAALLAQRP
ncbi:anti-sigma factor [Paracoccus sp. (in: a-proteobacteria)]|uniref:anti-sigma factor family protein n=1 Tax=Paracoccus sp. TaxID=267 RepID=UPI0026DF54D3|nr:hypothetical protein [Paracoccus sp. (in: a-proteobacteria)]MDO5368956.1 hypothetical protein [Paracoccus sp. (in: a-proteobacteria)]